MRAYILLSVAISWLALPTLAEITLPTVEACFDTAIAEQTNPARCIDQAQAPCLDNAQETPARTTLCFTEARQAWSSATGSRMDTAMVGLDEKKSAVLQIETKYDLLTSLIQCDRMEELSIAASDLAGDTIALQKARCLSTALALAYMRLSLTLRDIK